jgi:hypothetical protein
MEHKYYNTEEQIRELTNRIDNLCSMHDNPSQAVLIAYLAGIIDGEGTIRINKVKAKKNWNYSYYLQMSCGMTCKEVPELLKKIFGGNVREERVADGYRSIWRWALTGRFQIYVVLKLLKTYLIVKKEQVAVALDFCEKWKNPVRHHHVWLIDNQQISLREDMYWKMRKLNAVGKQAQRLNESGIREDEAIV